MENQKLAKELLKIARDLVSDLGSARPRGQFRGNGSQWEFGEDYQSKASWDWTADIGLYGKKDLSIEGATEQHPGFNKAIREIVKKYPEIMEYKISFDGPLVPIGEVLGLKTPERWDDIIFYHGTATAALDAILSGGLKSRMETGAAAAHGANLGKPSLHSDAVYLTTQKNTANFAARDAASKTKSKPVVLAIRGFSGNERSWVSDEDSRQDDPWESLRKLGSVAYKGTIPPKFIKVDRILD